MVFQPTPWQSAAFFWEDRRPDLERNLPSDLWLIPRSDSADHQDRIELTAYKGFAHKQPFLVPPLTAPPLFLVSDTLPFL